MAPMAAGASTPRRVGSALVSPGQGLADYCDTCLAVDLAYSGPGMHFLVEPTSKSWLQVSCSSPVRLEDLQPDVLHHVLLFLGHQDVGHLKQTSSKLRANTLQACQHWAPKVESWLMSDPSSSGLLKRLRDLELQPLAEGQQKLCDALMSVSNCTASSATTAMNLEPSAAISAEACGGGPSELLQQAQQQQLVPALAKASAAQEQQLQIWRPLAASYKAGCKLPKRLDWRQVWSCIQHAQQGPWQLDVQALAPAVSPNGVLLNFELLLQQPAPLLDPGSCEQPTMGWKDSVTVMSFVLDKKTVDIVVDTSGRVTSPQRDWCQGCIQLQPGQPRLLALEVSYIFPTPAWFLHPCTLAAPRPCSGSSGSSSCASSVSGMVLDNAWDSYSTSTSGSSMSIGQSAALCSAAPPSYGDGCSLASSSLSSSSSLGNGVSNSGGGSNGRPRLSLDLSVGFGCFIQDPRYADESAPNQQHRGLDRIELAAQVCWRPSKVQSWLGRLLPGIRNHGHTYGSSSSSSAHSGGNSSGGSSSPRVSGAAGRPVVCTTTSSSSSNHKQGSKPSFSVTLSKAAAWQVPSDTDRRFAEGFMFWAVQHKLELLLQQYGVLPRQPSYATATAAASTPLDC